MKLHYKVVSVVLSMLFVLFSIITNAEEESNQPSVAAVSATQSGGSNSSGESEEKPEFPPISEVTKGSQKIDGFFDLYQKDADLWMEIPQSRLEKEFFISRTYVRGFFFPGLIAGESIFYWKQNGNNLFLMLKNVDYVTEGRNPIYKAVENTFTDLVIAAVPIAGKEGGNFLIDLSQLLQRPGSDFVDVSFDSQRSTWGRIKNYPQNTDIEVEYVMNTGQSALRFSFSQIPVTDFTPRLADNRIGYFLTDKTDFAIEGAESSMVRYINRWNLKKAEPNAKLSPPIKPIVFYLENTIPYKYRPIVREAILEWNKAFEKAGFINAIEVRFQEEDTDWDPADVRYNTIRWVTSPIALAIGPSRVHPETGEIYDADILISDGWLNFYSNEYERYLDEAYQLLQENNPDEFIEAMAKDSIMNPYLQYQEELVERHQETYGDKPVFDGHEELHHCTFGHGLQMQLAKGALAAAIKAATDGEDGTAKKDKEDKEDDGVPEEFLRQALKHLVMHEVGHTLGLRHNFKSSAMIPYEKIDDEEYTAEHGLCGSVMDYAGIYVSPKDEEQKMWYSDRLGKYDFLAIEYGYTPVSGGSPQAEYEQLKDIAKNASKDEYYYGTDGDVAYDLDPLTNRWDLTDDPAAFAKEQTVLIKELLADLEERIVEEGEDYLNVRSGFFALFNDLFRNYYITSKMIGGYNVARDQKGDPEQTPNLKPVEKEQQQEYLDFLVDEVFSDETWSIKPDLMQQLQPDRWSYAVTGTMEVPYHQRVLSAQMSIIYRFFSPRVLTRVHDSVNYLDEGTPTLRMSEIYDKVTDSIFAELENEPENGSDYISSYRRNLQRAFVKQILIQHVVNEYNALPEDAKSLAWFKLNDLKNKIETRIEDESDIDTMSLAHLTELDARIQKALDSAYMVN